MNRVSSGGWKLNNALGELQKGEESEEGRAGGQSRSASQCHQITSSLDS